MRESKGFLLLLICLFIGNMISFLLPVSIPGSIIGMILMLFALERDIVCLDQVEGISQILIAHMVIIFMPGTINLISIYPEIAHYLLKLVLIAAFTTIFVILTTGFTVQKLIEIMEAKKVNE